MGGSENIGMGRASVELWFEQSVACDGVDLCMFGATDWPLRVCQSLHRIGFYHVPDCPRSGVPLTSNCCITVARTLFCCDGLAACGFDRASLESRELVENSGFTLHGSGDVHRPVPS